MCIFADVRRSDGRIAWRTLARKSLLYREIYNRSYFIYTRRTLLVHFTNKVGEIWEVLKMKEKVWLVFLFLMLFLQIGVFGISISMKLEDKKENKGEYSFEIYRDKDTGITMRIFKDKMGDVLYCEPVTSEMEVK